MIITIDTTCTRREQLEDLIADAESAEKKALRKRQKQSEQHRYGLEYMMADQEALRLNGVIEGL